MKFEELEIKGVFRVIPDKINDERGSFFRSFCKNEFSKITSSEFVQMNHSINTKKGTLRGMHFQTAPFGEEKIVRCIKGEVFDVFVDLRKNSPTFLKWGSVILSEQNGESVYLPKGIAHGFITLSDDSQLIYLHSEFYAPGNEQGLHPFDPRIAISWPTKAEVISARDLNHPFINNDFKGIEL